MQVTQGLMKQVPASERLSPGLYAVNMSSKGYDLARLKIDEPENGRIPCAVPLQPTTKGVYWF